MLHRRALEVFSDMQKRGLAPNEATLVVALVACAEVGALERGQQIHQAILAHQLPLSARLDTTLISMYAKCGQLMPAYQIFCTALQAQRADVVMWNAMLSGYAQHGYADHAEQMFNQMSVVGIQPNSGSFVSLLAAFSHTGKVDAARQIYRSMATDFGIRPTKPHQYCMVAVLSRAGMFDEAKLFIEKEIQFPDVVTWMTLLNACKNAKNLAVGEWAGNQALNLNPNDPAIYVLLGSLYGEAGQHEKKAQLWKQMQERNVEMIPGMSYIEASGRVHEFFMDNDEHKRIREVKERLKVERKKIEGMGYVANTACVLQPLGSDEEKRKHLWQHSEKLAFGMGLLSLPPRSVMNIYINQRVCEDSHDAIKRMSVTSGYGVSLRDSNRFHHIMSGKCSCKDWW
jgi:pentatricopeptide repeat protein